MMTLSRELGCQLFYETRPLTLTAAGEVVLRWSGKIVGDQAGLIEELDSMPAQDDARIAIADLLAFNALYVGMNEALDEAKVRYPGFRADYVEMQNSGLNTCQMVESGRVDISFEITLSKTPRTELSVPSGLTAIWVPEFHGELVCAVDKSSPLASPNSRPLRDFAQSRFVFQANRYSERFRAEFIELCTEVGFYPNITLDPSENPLEFYSIPPRDGVLLLSRVDKKYKPFIAETLRGNASIVNLNDEPRYVDAFAIARENVLQPELEFVLNRLKERAQACMRSR